MKCEDVSSFFTPETRIETSPIIRLGQRLKDRLGRVNRAIATRITHSSDPIVNERRDRQGNLYYQVYDPHTQKSAIFGSETEIRYWLEQRYTR